MPCLCTEHECVSNLAYDLPSLIVMKRKRPSGRQELCCSDGACLIKSNTKSNQLARQIIPHYKAFIDRATAIEESSHIL